jgi:hypothetical protein
MTDTTLHTSAIEAGQPIARLVLITPETAERWLTRNTTNRKIRPHHVGNLASDMEAGMWQITGESIKFDNAGNLIDGQHRLSAIVRSGQAVTMLVVSGLLPESQKVMDSGAKRSASDALKLANRSNTTVLASAARLAIAHESGMFKYPGANVPTVTHSQIITFVDLNPDLADAVEMVNGWQVVGLSRSAAAAAALRLRRISVGDAEEFIGSVLESRTEGRGDARAALIRRLQMARVQRERLRPSAEMWCIFRTWNAWRTGEDLKLLKFTPSYSWIEPK